MVPRYTPGTGAAPGTVESIEVVHVDDNPAVIELTTEALEHEDERYQVIPADSADAGIEYLADHPDRVDCLLSGYVLPGIDGLEFLDRVRDDHPDLPFLLFTAKGSEELASEAISSGVTDYIQKKGGPDQYTLLANRIENAVAGYRAQQATRETHQLFSRLLERAADYIFIVDAEGIIQYVTPSIEHVLGYPPEEVTDTSAFEYVHPEDIETASDEFAALQGVPAGEVTVEFRARDADGSWRWLEVRGRNLLDDPVIHGVVVNVRDITDRKDPERDR